MVFILAYAILLNVLNGLACGVCSGLLSGGRFASCGNAAVGSRGRTTAETIARNFISSPSLYADVGHVHAWSIRMQWFPWAMLLYTLSGRILFHATRRGHRRGYRSFVSCLQPFRESFLRSAHPSRLERVRVEEPRCALDFPWLCPPFPASCPFRSIITHRELPPHGSRRADFPQRVLQA